MTLIDTTTVSALLVVLALAVLATVVTFGVVLARVSSAHWPTAARPTDTWPHRHLAHRHLADRHLADPRVAVVRGLPRPGRLTDLQTTGAAGPAHRVRLCCVRGQPRSRALTASAENSWSTSSRVSPAIAASSPRAPSWSVRWRVARGSDSL